jgi:type IV secretion system protein VirB9
MKKIAISVLLALTPTLAFAGVVTNGVSTKALDAQHSANAGLLPAGPQSPKQQINAMLAVPFRTKNAAVSAEVKQWEQGHPAHTIVSTGGKVLYPFGQTIPTVVCSPLRVCDIQLQMGERVSNVSVGDSVDWLVKPAFSGSGDNIQTNVIVKPVRAGLTTNLMITTNRRAYQIDLKSANTGYTPLVGFYYPSEMVQQWNSAKVFQQKKSAQVKATTIADLPSFPLAAMDTAYSVHGDAPFKPNLIFNVEGKVYMRMPENMKYEAAPVLMLGGNHGYTQLVNYQMINNGKWIVVDRLFRKAALILGKGDNQTRVVIRYTGAGY